MATLNRNVITSADMANMAKARTPAELPATFDSMPPASMMATTGALEGVGTGGTTTAPGGVTTATADDYLTRLVKYVPLEVLGLYLFIEGIIKSNIDDARTEAWWLAGLLVFALVVTIPYDLRVLRVVRVAQVAFSVVGLAVYVFAVGGWFATTTWYHLWYGSITLPLFALAVAIVKLKPLPLADA